MRRWFDLGIVAVYRQEKCGFAVGAQLVQFRDGRCVLCHAGQIIVEYAGAL